MPKSDADRMFTSTTTHGADLCRPDPHDGRSGAYGEGKALLSKSVDLEDLFSSMFGTGR